MRWNRSFHSLGSPNTQTDEPISVISIGESLLFESLRDECCSGTQLTHPKAEGTTLLQVSFTFPPTVAQIVQGRSRCWLSWGCLPWQGRRQLIKADEMGFGRQGGIHVFRRQRMSGQQFGRLWEATGGLFATWYIFNGRAS